MLYKAAKREAALTLFGATDTRNCVNAEHPDQYLHVLEACPCVGVCGGEGLGAVSFNARARGLPVSECVHGRAGVRFLGSCRSVLGAPARARGVPVSGSVDFVCSFFFLLEWVEGRASSGPAGPAEATQPLPPAHPRSLSPPDLDFLRALHTRELFAGCSMPPPPGRRRCRCRPAALAPAQLPLLLFLLPPLLSAPLSHAPSPASTSTTPPTPAHLSACPFQ